MKTKLNNKKHIWIISVLIIAFFIIMLVSGTFQNSDVSYNFYDEIEFNQLDYQLNIGEISIVNNGLIPIKVKLDSYRACIVDSKNSNYGDYYVTYSKSDNEFVGGYFNSYIELGPYKSETLKINTDRLPYVYGKSLDETINVINESEIQLNIYKIEKNEYYNYCNDPIYDDLIHTTNVLIENVN